MITDNEFITAVKESISIRGLLEKLNLIPSGGNYKVAKAKILKLKLDTSHFLGMGYLKGKTHNWNNTKTPSSKIFKKNSKYLGTTNNIKNRLIKDGFAEWKCYSCGLTEWKNNKIPLELEHKNGDNKDNRKENLTLLCPNCHALTDTYRGKNKRKRLMPR